MDAATAGMVELGDQLLLYLPARRAVSIVIVVAVGVGVIGNWTGATETADSWHRRA